MSGADVVVFGSLHLDIVVRAPALPRLGETLAGNAWRQVAGGKGGNQAVAAARHGAAVAMIGAVGDDAFGTTLLDNLRAHGVDVAQVAVRTGQASGMSVAITEAAGDYAAVIVSGVNLALDAGAVRAAASVIGVARWLVLQNEVPEAANLAAATVARAAGCRVMLNAAPARALPAELRAMLDILVVNALEAEALGGVAVSDGASALVAAERLSAGGCAIVTCGGAGVAVAGAERFVVPGHAVQVISTHGAGDAFVGALAARLAQGAAMEPAVRHANAAAAALVATPAAERGAPQLDMIERLLRAG